MRFFASVAFAVIFACVSCTSVRSRYEVGQVWSYRNSPSISSNLVILEVHKDPRYGQVVFVAVDGLDITTADEREIHRVFSMPFSRAALDGSVISLIRKARVEPWGQGELAGPTYKEWNGMNGNANTSAVSEFLESLRHLRFPLYRYDPPFPNSPSPS